MRQGALILATLAIALLLGSGEPALAQSTVVRIDPAWKVASPYESSFSVEVWVDDVVTTDPCTPYSSDPCGLGAYEFTAIYEPSVIEFQSVVNGPFLGSTGRVPSCTTTYPGADRVRYRCHSKSPVPGEFGPVGPEGSGLLATLTFAPLQIGDSPMDLVSVALGDVTADPIPHTTQDGSVTVDYAADLSVEKTAPETVTAPGNIEYDVQVTNLGPDEAEDVTLVDTLSSSVDFESASPGCTYDDIEHKVTCDLDNIGATLSDSVSITVSVAANKAGRTINNAAAASSATVDPDPDNNHDPASTTVDLANVDIVKSAPEQVVKGATDQYEIVVTSTGPSEAASVEVTDILPSDVVYVDSTTTLGYCFYWSLGEPAVLCALDDMAPSASATITITVTFPDFDWYSCNKAEAGWTQIPAGVNESQWACTEVGQPDRDGDGCTDAQEAGDDPAQGGDRDWFNPWDFYDVPAPTIHNGGSMDNRDRAVSINNDVLGILEYNGTSDGGPCNTGPDGIGGNEDDRCYNDDKDGDGVADGVAYDRSPGTQAVPPHPWSDAPDSAISINPDVLLALDQNGHSCAGPPPPSP